MKKWGCWQIYPDDNINIYIYTNFKLKRNDINTHTYIYIGNNLNELSSVKHQFQHEFISMVL